MSEILSLTLIFSAIRLATPLIFAALGGMFSERSGVINIALEGLMLAGAFTAAAMTYELQNPYLGLLCGMAAGAVTALVYAVAVIKFEANQVVAGTAINFLMLGLPQLISGAVYDSSGSTPQIAKEFLLPEFFNLISIASILAFLLVPLCWYVLYKTPFGLRLRATGENPAAADAAGISVIRIALHRRHLVGSFSGGGRRVSVNRTIFALYARNDGGTRIYRACSFDLSEMETCSGFVRVSVFRFHGSSDDSAGKHQTRFGRKCSGAVRSDNSVCFDDYCFSRFHRFIACAEGIGHPLQ